MMADVTPAPALAPSKQLPPSAGARHTQDNSDNIPRTPYDRERVAVPNRSSSAAPNGPRFPLARVSRLQSQMVKGEGIIKQM
jgi:hypothetical protein